jgi:hypothetical protein
MFIYGHIDIIKDLLPADYFNLPYKKFNKKLILKGLAYVDAPCGSYTIKQDHVFFKRTKLCSVTSLINLFYEKTHGETEHFQTHKGFFAHLHAMTTHPDNTVLKIRNKIIVSILGYCLLALYDQSDNVCPNSLWAGMILHIITDSYSPAHTIREPHSKHSIIKRDDIHNNDKKMRLGIHESIKELAKENIIYTKDELIHKLTSNKFVNHNKEQLWKAYKSFKFEYDLNKKVANLIPSNYKVTGPEQYGDITAFQYYDNQPLLLHMKLDLLSYVKSKLYKRMKDECILFLKYYKDAIITGDVDTFLKNVLKLMLEKTFRIHEKYLNNKTNWIIRD